MDWYIELFITENTLWCWHSLHVPKPERPFSTAAKAPATKVAKRGKKRKRQKISGEIKSAATATELSSWSQLRHPGRNTSPWSEMPPKTLPGHLERMVLRWQDLFPNQATVTKCTTNTNLPMYLPCTSIQITPVNNSHARNTEMRWNNTYGQCPVKEKSSFLANSRLSN